MKWCVGYPYTIGEGLCLLFFCKLKAGLLICKNIYNLLLFYDL